MHLAPDHQPDQLVGRGLGDAPRAGKPPVLQHRNRVAERKYLGKAVRNVDDRHAVPGEPPHDFEQFLGLGQGQRRCRLVEDEHPQIARQRLGDLDNLRLRRRQRSDLPRRIDLDAELGDQSPRFVAHQPHVDLAEPFGWLAAGKDVLGDRQLRHQRAFLVHDADAEIAGGLLVELAEFDAVEQDAALAARVDAGDDLAECRLAGAVLAEQRADLAAVDAHRDVVERPHAGEELRQISYLEPRRHGGGLGLCLEVVAFGRLDHPDHRLVVRGRHVDAAAGIDDGAVDDLDLGLALCLDVLQHRCLAADRLSPAVR